jgi:hypothetical protein
MTSRRSWLLGLALGAAVTVGSIHDVHAQGVPRSFTYQGQLLENGQPVTGNHTITVALYKSSGPAIFTQSFTQTIGQDGIFNLTLSGFDPNTVDFNEQYFLGVSVDGGVELPKTPLQSSPYAINADLVDGHNTSLLGQDGKLDASWLPAAQNSLLTINGVAPDNAGNFNVTAGSGVTITQGTNGITIAASSQGGGIQTIATGPGLIGGGGPDQNGQVFIGLAPNAIDNTMIGNGVITGAKLAAVVAGLGLYQDILGNLNVGVDNATLEIPQGGDLLQIKAGGVGTA